MQNIFDKFMLAGISITRDQAGLPGGGATESIGSGITATVNLLTFLVGALSVIFIIVAGFKIITSAGDSRKYENGRDTLFYAIIGLILALTSYAIVNFIIKQV